MEISVRELKANLSKYLQRVKGGGTVIVTSHGKPTARLVGLGIGAESEAISRLRAQPWLQPGNGAKPRGAQHPIKARRGELLSVALLERE